MEYKHFTHSHSLILHQVPQGTELACSGCKSHATGSVYACWQCNFFLHEFCFNASRSMMHPSHPLHPLTLVPYPTYPSNSFFCNSCNLSGNALSYSCSNCDFDLHVHCAFIPTTTMIQQPYSYVPNSDQTPTFTPQIPSLNYPETNGTNLSFVPSIGTNVSIKEEVPLEAEQLENSSNTRVKARGIKHFSHPHPLYLIQVGKEELLVCSGCDEEILDLEAHKCNKSNCEFHLHKNCFGLAREIWHKSHVEHPLILLSSSPYNNTKNGEFTCSACCGVGSAFTYHCSTCKYDLHVNCAALPETVRREGHDHMLTLTFSRPKIQKTEQEVEEEEQQQLPGLSFCCDVCKSAVPESCWLYYCQECDYGTHLNCVNLS